MCSVNCPVVGALIRLAMVLILQLLTYAAKFYNIRNAGIKQHLQEFARIERAIIPMEGGNMKCEWKPRVEGCA